MTAYFSTNRWPHILDFCVLSTSSLLGRKKLLCEGLKSKLSTQLKEILCNKPVSHIPRSFYGTARIIICSPKSRIFAPSCASQIESISPTTSSSHVYFNIIILMCLCDLISKKVSEQEFYKLILFKAC